MTNWTTSRRRTAIAAAIAIVGALTHVDAHHERDYGRDENALEEKLEQMIGHSSVFRYVHSIRIDDVEHNEAGERVLARRDSSGHRITARTSYAPFPVYDAIDSNRRLRTTREPGKSVSVALVLRELDDLVDDFDVQDTISETLAAIYESIYKLNLQVCTATVVLHADLLEYPAGTEAYHHIYVMGPLFGTVLTARRAASAPWNGYGPGAPPFWALLFVREGFNIKRLLGYVPQWDRPSEGYPCPSDE